MAVPVEREALVLLETVPSEGYWVVCLLVLSPKHGSRHPVHGCVVVYGQTRYVIRDS